MNLNRWVSIGAIVSGLAVVLGAFGAHGLEGRLAELYPESEMSNVGGQEFQTSWKRLQDFRTAAEYQMYHGLGMILLGAVAGRRQCRSVRVAGWSFLGGTLLFSGSLYILLLTGLRWLGAITPIGGVLLIVGWTAFAVAASGATQNNELTSNTNEQD